jgi:hypothetical protein
VLLSADCVAYAVSIFRKEVSKGIAFATACPKLDEGKNVCGDKIIGLIDTARIKGLTVVRMEMSCCRGLLGTRSVSRAARGALEGWYPRNQD